MDESLVTDWNDKKLSQDGGGWKTQNKLATYKNLIWQWMKLNENAENQKQIGEISDKASISVE